MQYNCCRVIYTVLIVTSIDIWKIDLRLGYTYLLIISVVTILWLVELVIQIKSLYILDTSVTLQSIDPHYKLNFICTGINLLVLLPFIVLYVITLLYMITQ